MTRVAIYTRLSKETGPEPQTATQRQEKACRAFCEAKGWEVLTVAEDVDLSAYQPGVHRPAFEELLRMVDAKSIDGVLVWKLDRLCRRPADFERFWATCEYHSVFVASVTEPIDTSTEMGLAFVRILVTFAGLESSTKSLRIKAKMKELAERGKPPSGPRAFGWTRDRSALMPDEAERIRRAADDVLHGASLRSIAREWNAAGYRLPGGNPWHGTAVRTLLKNPRLVGDRVHHGEIVATNCWPAILERDTFARVRLLLADPRRASVTERHHYLLTGLLRCGKCGGSLIGTYTMGARRYICPRPPYGCSGLGIVADPLERWLVAQASRRSLSEPPTRSAQELMRRALAVEELCHDYYNKHLISRAQFLQARASIDDDARLPAEPSLDELDSRGRRAWIARRLRCATIKPIGHGGPFTPARVDACWHHEPDGPMPVPVTITPRATYRSWLTNEEARHVLCDMGTDAFRHVLHEGRLRPNRSRGPRFKRSEVVKLLDSMRHVPGTGTPRGN